jgi:putative sporulation protein YyaC
MNHFNTSFSDKKEFWRKIPHTQLVHFLQMVAQSVTMKYKMMNPTDSHHDILVSHHLLFTCIGSDKSTGDALGPLVGTGLLEAGYTHVMGSLKNPLDASNIEYQFADFPKGFTSIAIDAALGMKSSVGLFQVSNRPIAPGISVGKSLPLIGDYSIAAIVNANGANQRQILQNTSLYHVMNLAQQIIDAIKIAIPLNTTQT